VSLALNGIGVSRGIAIGSAHLIRNDQLEIPEQTLPPSRLDAEVRRFRKALKQSKQQLQAIRKRVPSNTPADIAAFIDTHLLMLDDTTLSEEPIRLIRATACNAEWAIKQQRDALVGVFERMDDPYLRTRRDDVVHVINRLLRTLLQRGPRASEEQMLQGAIVIADDLTPADMVMLQSMDIAAFITESGGPLSHTAILARSLRIPAIVGAHQTAHYVRDGETVIVDGDRGAILIDPDPRTLKHYRKIQREQKRQQSELAKLKQQPAITHDQQKIELLANIELPEDMRLVNRVGADGIGLFRTEFLYMNRKDTPSEEEQLRAYRRVVKSLKGRPVTIRTLDLGADKEVDGGHASGRLCSNPALGLRAIRLCLQDPELFKPQLRAILRASASGPVKIMLPMISHLQEVVQTRQLLEQVKSELRAERRPFDEQIEIGGMIEIPAAALSAHDFARQLDFLSLGTNDLIQYTLAIDRVDDSVNYLYDPVHPAVLRLIQLTLQAGRSANIPVSMCGEMASDPRYTRLLLGLGLTQFSMQPSALLEIKQTINATHIGSIEQRVRRRIQRATPEQILALIEELNLPHSR